MYVNARQIFPWEKMYSKTFKFKMLGNTNFALNCDKENVFILKLSKF